MPQFSRLVGRLLLPHFLSRACPAVAVGVFIVACSNSSGTSGASQGATEALGTAALGEPCVQGAACASGLCIPEITSESGTSWADGSCSQTCGADSSCPVDGACVTFADGSAYCAAPCSDAEGCRVGYVCSPAVEACLPDCRLGWSCGTTLSCDEGTGSCVVPSASGGAVGEACSADTACQSSLCITETAADAGVLWSQGYCSQACSDALACPDGAVCVSFEDGSAYCASECTESASCRTGYVCSAAVGGCLPDCRLGWSCGASLSCDANSGRCVSIANPIGGTCALDADCESALCTPEETTTAGTAWAGGSCTQACAADAPCPTGASCVTYADGAAYCSAACSADTECRTGYVCSSDVGACLPDCRQGWSCGTSLSCDAGTGNCVSGTSPIGSPCVLDADCASALCTPEETTATGSAWPSGSCTQACSAEVACPSGASCVPYADGSSYCSAACVGDTDCRSGYVCATAVSACLPDCRTGFSCGTLACDANAGTCG